MPRVNLTDVLNGEDKQTIIDIIGDAPVGKAADSELLDGKDSSEFALTGVANIFTEGQRITVEASANAVDFSGTGEIEFTATAANITIGTMATKKWLQGSMTIHSAENVTGWGTEFRFAPDFSAVTPTPPASMTGTMKFWFEIREVNGVDGGTGNIVYVSWAK